MTASFRRSLALFVVGAAAMSASNAAMADTISFETTTLSGGYEYNASSPYTGPNPTFSNPTSEGVTFSGTSGIQANGSGWGFTAAPDGTQTAFLQTYDGDSASPGSITFSFNLTGGAKDELIFDVEGRPNYLGSGAFAVTANGTTTAFAAPSTSSWAVDTVTFTALAGTNSFTIAIDGQSTTDLSIGVDKILVASTPLPATWMMFLAAFCGLACLGQSFRGRQTA
jgi:hypothetical protein